MADNDSDNVILIHQSQQVFRSTISSICCMTINKSYFVNKNFVISRNLNNSQIDVFVKHKNENISSLVFRSKQRVKIQFRSTIIG